MHLAFFELAMLIPWILGFAIVKPFLKQRSGHLFFAIGAGYVLGWFVTTLILRVYDYFERPFDIYEIVAIECAIAIPLLFLPAKELRIDELRLEKSPPRLVWLLLGVIVCLLFYRWGLTMVDLLSKPVFPWDGWLSWSAKAKIFYYSQDIPPLTKPFTPFWALSNAEEVAVYGKRHPYFVSLVQTYAAMAWGGWSDEIVSIPWLGLSVATAFGVFGGLRSLGADWLPSILAGYLVVSMPIFDIHVSLGAYADLWVGVAFLVTVLLVVIFFEHKDRNLLPLIFVFALIVYFSKNTALVFFVGLACVIAWRFFGWKICFSVTAILGLCFYWLLSGGVGHASFKTLSGLLSSGFTENMLAFNFSVKEFVLRQWVILDNWHYAFIAGCITYVLAFFCSKKHNRHLGMSFLAASAIGSFVVMLFITFFTRKMMGSDFVGYVNRVSLYFMPLFALLPIAVYQLIRKNKGSEVYPRVTKEV